MKESTELTQQLLELGDRYALLKQEMEAVDEMINALMKETLHQRNIEEGKDAYDND